MTTVLRAVLGRVRIDFHAAHWVKDAALRVMVVVMMI
jgi:hypothetical protein